MSFGERMLNAHFSKETKINDSFLEFEYLDCEKDFQDIMRDVRWNAKKNILAIQTVRSPNGLFGLQCYSSNADIPPEEIIQL